MIKRKIKKIVFSFSEIAAVCIKIIESEENLISHTLFLKLDTLVVLTPIIMLFWIFISSVKSTRNRAEKYEKGRNTDERYAGKNGFQSLDLEPYVE